METRYCKRCKMTKALNLFYKTREYKGKSYYSCCKECWNKRTIENRSKSSVAALKKFASAESTINEKLPVEVDIAPWE